jgi:hypothetical protein
LESELCQIIGYELFFIWHIFLEIGKTQDLPSKIWQNLGDALLGIHLILAKREKLASNSLAKQLDIPPLGMRVRIRGVPVL